MGRNFPFGVKLYQNDIKWDKSAPRNVGNVGKTRQNLPSGGAKIAHFLFQFVKFSFVYETKHADSV